MKILGLMSMDLFRLSTGWALEELGHQVFYLDEADPEVLDHAIQQFQPDMVFDMGWDALHAQAESIYSILQRYPVFHLYFAEEDPIHFSNWSLYYCDKTKPQMVLTRNSSCIPQYEALGYPVIAMDVGCNPAFHRPVPPNPAHQCDIAIVANAQLDFDIYRRECIRTLISPLMNTSYHIRIYGRGWEKSPEVLGFSVPPAMLHGIVPFHITNQIYNSAKINISIQSIEEQLSSRTFDILAAGGFLLTTDTPGVRAHFQPGIHCEAVATADQLLEKVGYYLNHDEERKQIAANGRGLVMERDSYVQRFSQVWGKVEEVYTQFRNERGVS